MDTFHDEINEIRRLAGLEPLNEAPPLRKYDPSGIGQWHGGRVEKLAKHPAFRGKVENIFKNIPYPVDIIFVEPPGTDAPSGSTPWREQPYEPTQKEFGRLVRPTKASGLPKGDPDAITILIMGTGEYYDTDFPLTPWMIAHRLSHAVEPLVRNLHRSIEKILLPYVKKYGHNWESRTDKGTRKERAIQKGRYLFPVFVDIIDTRSAREGTLVEQGEHTHELFASYMVRGRTKLTRGNVSDNPKWIPLPALRKLENEYDQFFSETLADMVGKTYFMY